MTEIGPATIVCGLDGSAGCIDVARIATGLARQVGARVELVHVLDAGRPTRTDPEHVLLRAQAMLDGICHSSEAAVGGQLVECGDPARRIAAVAEREQASLIVVGTRGNAPVADALLGSVSSRLAADAPCPVLILPPALRSHIHPERWPNRTIVCGYDGSVNAWNAAISASLIAARLRAGLSLVSVGTALSWRVDQAAARLGRWLSEHSEPGDFVPEIEWEVRAGDPAWELEHVSRAMTAPLLVIGSRGLGPWHDPLLGSVARRVLLAARRPTLVCPATAGAVATGAGEERPSPVALSGNPTIGTLVNRDPHLLRWLR